MVHLFVAAGSFVLCIFLLCPRLQGGDIPVPFLDHVVAIGRKDATPGPNQGKWIGEASGFFYRQFVSKANETMNNYAPFLVTNRHVIEEHIAATNGPLSIRLNPKAGGAAREIDFPLVVDGKSTWHAHPDPQVDLAVVTLNGPWFERAGSDQASPCDLRGEFRVVGYFGGLPGCGVGGAGRGVR